MTPWVTCAPRGGVYVCDHVSLHVHPADVFHRPVAASVDDGWEEAEEAEEAEGTEVLPCTRKQRF